MTFRKLTGFSDVLKAAIILAYFGLWWTIYLYTNEYACQPGRATYLDRPANSIPQLIQPWTAVIYVFGGMTLPLIPFCYYRTWPRVGFVLTCYGLASAVAFTCYWLWPVAIVRDSFAGPGLGKWLMRHVLSVDRAANCTPSSHVIYAILPALLVQNSGAARRIVVAVWIASLAVSMTTVTTGQHYWIDIASGALVASVSYLCVVWIHSFRIPATNARNDAGR